jgi:hypothetical protein
MPLEITLVKARQEARARYQEFLVVLHIEAGFASYNR